MKKRLLAVLLCLLLMLPCAARAEAVDEFPGLICGESVTASLKGPAIPSDASDITFSVDALPSGLSLVKEETGSGVKFLLTGTPKQAAQLLWCRAVFSWHPAGEEEAETETRLLAITVNPVFETGTHLPDGRVGEPYRAQLKGRSGFSEHIFRVNQNTEGLKAMGLSLSEDGVISGTPTAAGEVSFSAAMNVRGQPDMDGYRTEQSFTLSVAAAETAAPTTVPATTTASSVQTTVAEPDSETAAETTAAASTKETETQTRTTTTVENKTTEKAETGKVGKADTKAIETVGPKTTAPTAVTAPRPTDAAETAPASAAETVPVPVTIPTLRPGMIQDDAPVEDTHWGLLWLLLIPAGAGLLLILVWALRRSGGKHSQ